MANNILVEEATSFTLPVASGTVSGDAVLVGCIPGVAVTDRDSDGNATVKIAAAPVVEISLASAVVTSAGTALYITSAGVVSATSAANSAVFGAALEAKSSGSAKTVKCLLTGAQPLQAS